MTMHGEPPIDPPDCEQPESVLDATSRLALGICAAIDAEPIHRSDKLDALLIAVVSCASDDGWTLESARDRLSQLWPLATAAEIASDEIDPGPPLFKCSVCGEDSWRGECKAGDQCGAFHRRSGLPHRCIGRMFPARLDKR